MQTGFTNNNGFPIGERYETEIPDTLDIVYHAEQAINCLIGTIKKEQDYECIWCVRLVPPTIKNHEHEWFDSSPRTLEALTLLRTITGSTYGLEKENGLLNAMISRIGDDGIVYHLPYREDTPWRYKSERSGKEARMDDDVSSITVNAMLSIALLERYQRDNDRYMLDVARKLIYGLVNIAIIKDDYAYYPATPNEKYEFSYYRKMGWPDTAEAANEMENAEGAVTCYIGLIIRAMCKFYSVTGDCNILELAGRLVKYILKPRFWLGNIEKWSDDGENVLEGYKKMHVWRRHGGAQRKPAALFKAHFSGITYTLENLIDYAMVAGDDYVKEFVRQGYEYMRNLGLARIGMWGENIASSYAAAIAIKLCDAGVGDYWEDVDQYIRNCMVEDQINDADIIKGLCRERNVPVETGEYTIERFMGGLCHNGNIDMDGTLDPTSNMAQISCPYQEAYYFVWEGITRYKDGMAQVNLLLNRVSPWVDIESHLPYEGKVIIRNKISKHIAVRISKWIDKDRIESCINGEKADFYIVGNYIQFANVNPGDVINLEFPMKESVETYYLIGMSFDPKRWFERIEELPTYVLRLKGNTCVQTDFVNKDKFPNTNKFGDPGRIRYPIYQRKHMIDSSKAPIKKVTRFVAKNRVTW